MLLEHVNKDHNKISTPVEHIMQSLFKLIQNS